MRVIHEQIQELIVNAREGVLKRQFDVGKSTSTDVLDASTRLALQQLEEISAIADYQIAQIDLAAATGTLLGATRIRWEPSQPDRGINDTISTEAAPNNHLLPAPAPEEKPPAPQPNN